MWLYTCISNNDIKLHGIYLIIFRWNSFRNILVFSITLSTLIFLSDFFVLRYRKISKFCSLVFVRCQTKFVFNTSWMTKWLWKKFWLVTCEKEKYWLTYKFLVLFVKDKLRRCFIFLAKDDDTSDSWFGNVWRNTKNMLKQNYGKNVSMTYWHFGSGWDFFHLSKKWILKFIIVNFAKI